VGIVCRVDKIGLEGKIKGKEVEKVVEKEGREGSKIRNG